MAAYLRSAYSYVPQIIPTQFWEDPEYRQTWSERILIAQEVVLRLGEIAFQFYIFSSLSVALPYIALNEFRQLVVKANGTDLDKMDEQLKNGGNLFSGTAYSSIVVQALSPIVAVTGINLDGIKNWSNRTVIKISQKFPGLPALLNTASCVLTYRAFIISPIAVASYLACIELRAITTQFREMIYKGSFKDTAEKPINAETGEAAASHQDWDALFAKTQICCVLSGIFDCITEEKNAVKIWLQDRFLQPFVNYYFSNHGNEKETE